MNREVFSAAETLSFISNAGVPGSGRILEKLGAVIAAMFDQLYSFLKIVRGLTRKLHDVGRQGDIFRRRPNAVDLFLIAVY